MIFQWNVVVMTLSAEHQIDQIRWSLWCRPKSIFQRCLLHLVDIEISIFACCARDIEIPAPCARERAPTLKQESVWRYLRQYTLHWRLNVSMARSIAHFHRSGSERGEPYKWVSSGNPMVSKIDGISRTFVTSYLVQRPTSSTSSATDHTS